MMAATLPTQRLIMGAKNFRLKTIFPQYPKTYPISSISYFTRKILPIKLYAYTVVL
jgi:hypothetical protein